MTAQGLIDTTEMYLRTVFELEEEGIVPLRARIAERLAQRGPTVSQTVARMARDGLLLEACRWEHVISESVERRLYEMLGYPIRCPHGNIIPGLDELGIPPEAKEEAEEAGGDEAMTNAASRDPVPVVVQRISEQIQSDLALMLKLKRTGIQPGREVMLAASDDGVRVTCDDSADGTGAELPREIAAHVFVSRT